MDSIWKYPCIQIYCDRLRDVNGGLFDCVQSEDDNPAKFTTSIMFPGQLESDPISEYVLELYANGVGMEIYGSVYVGGKPEDVFFQVVRIRTNRDELPNTGGEVEVTIYLDLT